MSIKKLLLVGVKKKRNDGVIVTWIWFNTRLSIIIHDRILWHKMIFVIIMVAIELVCVGSTCI